MRFGSTFLLFSAALLAITAFAGTANLYAACTTNDCVGIAMAKASTMKAMVRVEGVAGANCFVSFKANGTVAPFARCRTAVPALRGAATWHWQGEDIVLLGPAGQRVMLFVRVEEGHWRFDRPGAPSIHLHRMMPEVQPHL